MTAEHFIIGDANLIIGPLLTCSLYPVQARDAVMGDADNELAQLVALQAKASKKEADFETRKRARLTEEFNSDKGQCSWGLAACRHCAQAASPALTEGTVLVWSY